ncbi:MAG TPA: hypothetical protein VHR35_14170 [Nocardioides sp.]|jgi:hypothetical protein|nr:hypothetical protein [Nocardioides sp.]
MLRPGGGSARHRNRRNRTWLIIGLVVLLVVVAGVVLAVVRPFGGGDQRATPPPPSPTASRGAPLDSRGRPYRPFRDRSWWNTPVPLDAPHDPQETQILDYLRTAPQSGNGCLRLAGAQSNKWGQPAYWAQPGDPQYAVQGLPDSAPPEVQHLRIPKGAESAKNSDGTMSVYDVDRGYVMLLTDAHYDAAKDTWSASGATVTYLDSNGLSAATGKSDNPHNMGTHRGNNGATSYVRYDMVRAGDVRNVLKIAAGPELANRWVFPMTGSDGGVTDPSLGAPPEGLRMRLKPSIDLNALGLHPQALVIAKALQTYGVYIGDSGGTTALKLEDTKAEGLGQRWNVTADDLCRLPFTPQYWDVLPEGYDPSAH